MHQTTVSFPEPLLTQLRQRAARDDRSLSNTVLHLLLKGIKSEEIANSMHQYTKGEVPPDDF